MSLHEQSHPEVAPENLDAKTGDTIGLRFVLRAVAKILAVLLALALLPFWFYLSSIAEVTLDYPVRLAGLDPRYPARGTFEFWWGWFIQTSRAAGLAGAFGGIVLIPALSLLMYYGFSIRQKAGRIITLLVFASGPYIYGYMLVRFPDKLRAVWELLEKLPRFWSAGAS